MHSPTVAVFDLAVVPNRSRVLLRLRGELDLATAPRLARAVDELREVGWDAIALDLYDVEIVDSTGLRLLLGVWARARREGRRFELRGRCGPLERLLCVAGLQDWFTRA